MILTCDLQEFYSRVSAVSLFIQQEMDIFIKTELCGHLVQSRARRALKKLVCANLFRLSRLSHD